tara:strand:- start:2960 stop:3088 length:129 start_codon:yes stop_codon:yes gene_type:complete
MKTLYITLTLFAILLISIFIIYLVDIPSPSKIVEETYKLKIK